MFNKGKFVNIKLGDDSRRTGIILEDIEVILGDVNVLITSDEPIERASFSYAFEHEITPVLMLKAG